MADVVTLTHIRLNYAQMLCLKDVKFRNKAIESKLLNLSALGSEMFVVKNFDILHTSTRETQHIQSKNSINLKRNHEVASGIKLNFYPLPKKPRTDF